MIKEIASVILGIFIPSMRGNGYQPIGELHIPPHVKHTGAMDCKTWDGKPGHTPKKPTPASKPHVHGIALGCAIGDPPPPVHQNGRPTPPPKRKAMTNQEYLKTLSYDDSCNLIYLWAFHNWTKESFATADFRNFIDWLEKEHDDKEDEKLWT